MFAVRLIDVLDELARLALTQHLKIVCSVSGSCFRREEVEVSSAFHLTHLESLPHSAIHVDEPAVRILHVGDARAVIHKRFKLTARLAGFAFGGSTSGGGSTTCLTDRHDQA